MSSPKPLTSPHEIVQCLFIDKKPLPKGSRIDAKDAEGQTVLLWLLANTTPKNADMIAGRVAVLIGLNASVDVTDKHGFTAMHYAARENNLAAINLLAAKNEKLVRRATNDFVTPLHLAAWNGNVAAIQALVAMDKTLLSDRDSLSGRTPLCYAIENNQSAAIPALVGNDPQLLRAGCLSDSKSPRDNEPLPYAIICDKPDMIRQLLLCDPLLINEYDGQYLLALAREHQATNAMQAIYANLQHLNFTGSNFVTEKPSLFNINPKRVFTLSETLSPLLAPNNLKTLRLDNITVAPGDRFNAIKTILNLAQQPQSQLEFLSLNNAGLDNDSASLLVSVIFCASLKQLDLSNNPGIDRDLQEELTQLARRKNIGLADGEKPFVILFSEQPIPKKTESIPRTSSVSSKKHFHPQPNFFATRRSDAKSSVDWLDGKLSSALEQQRGERFLPSDDEISVASSVSSLSSASSGNMRYDTLFSSQTPDKRLFASSRSSMQSLLGDDIDPALSSQGSYTPPFQM